MVFLQIQIQNSSKVSIAGWIAQDGIQFGQPGFTSMASLIAIVPRQILSKKILNISFDSFSLYIKRYTLLSMIQLIIYNFGIAQGFVPYKRSF